MPSQFSASLCFNFASGQLPTTDPRSRGRFIPIFYRCHWVIGEIICPGTEFVCRQTVIVGLFFQQAIALFVLKSDAGFKIFRWLAFLASDFLEESRVGAIFFFDQDTVLNKFWFFTNVLSAIIFFIAFVQMMYYLGVMQWFIKHL